MQATHAFRCNPSSDVPAGGVASAAVARGGALARRLTIIGRYGLCFSKHVAMAAHHALVSGF